MSTISTYKNEYSQEETLDRWAELIAYWRWYPDAWLEAITPTELDEETGEVKRVGITWGGDQKLYLRAMARFAYTYFVLPRGFG